MLIGGRLQRLGRGLAVASVGARAPAKVHAVQILPVPSALERIDLPTKTYRAKPQTSYPEVPSAMAELPARERRQNAGPSAGPQAAPHRVPAQQELEPAPLR
ncbi:MAG: hypothetical protein IT285_05525 [Bdellovibrionales bacterium]|nr:hypothetical protein [Bdellovibrionales bacterium]